MHSQSPIVWLFVSVSLLFLSCEFHGIEDQEDQPASCSLNMDSLDFSFGIQYDQPELYLQQGEQSNISDSLFALVLDEIGLLTDTLSSIQTVATWMNTTFTTEIAGGSMIGVPTVNDLVSTRVFYGCHSGALILSSVLRSYGFPAVMIESAGVQWAFDYSEGLTQSFGGHVMSEIYVQGEWILLDNNGSLVKDYDPLDPFISMQNWNPDDYFVYAKGLDTWDYSGQVDNFTQSRMVEFTENLVCYEDMFFTNNYTWQ